MNIGLMFAAMALQGRMRVKALRSATRKNLPPSSYRMPHEGKREIARRKRQIERGILQVSK